MDKLLTDVILSDKFSRLKGRIGGDKCFAQFQEIGTLWKYIVVENPFNAFKNLQTSCLDVQEKCLCFITL